MMIAARNDEEEVSAVKSGFGKAHASVRVGRGRTAADWAARLGSTERIANILDIIDARMQRPEEATA